MALWTPGQIETALWLDASATSDLTVDGSGYVSAWADHKGNGRVLAQSTASAQPVLNNTDGSVEFDGSVDHLFMEEAPFFAQGSLTMIAVVTPLSMDTDKRWLTEGSSTNGSPIYTTTQTHNINMNRGTGFIRDDANDQLVYQDDLDYQDMWLNGDTHINYFGDSGSGIELGKNGVLGNEYAYTRNTLTMDRFALGGILRGSFCCGMNIRVHELIMTPAKVGSATRQKIEGYLAHKWGLAANLPADHPYKTAAPVVTSVSGIITDASGNPCQRSVYAMSRPQDGSAPQVLAHGLSDPVTGEYELVLPTEEEVTRVVVSEDDDPLLNDLVDRVIPG